MADKDTRLFVKITLDFPSNPKIKPLSDAAFRCLVEALVYARDHLTDGFLARRLALASWSLEVLQELCTNDSEKPSLIEREEGWYITDYAEHQDTKADVDARRERAKAAGQKGGLAKAKRPAKRTAKRTASETLSNNVAEERSKKRDISTTTANAVVVERARGTRIPDAWMPPESVIAQMRSEHPGVDLRAEHAKFLDYWRAQPGAKGRKADWTATWRNWIRRAAEQQQTASVNGKPKSKVRGLSTLAAEQRAAEQRQSAAKELE